MSAPEIESPEAPNVVERIPHLILLNQIGRLLTATLELPKVIEQLLPAVTEIVSGEGSSVWLWDEALPGWLVCQAVYNRGEHRPLTNVRLGPGQGIAGWVAQSGESVVVSNAAGDARFFGMIDSQSGFQTTSLLAVPLRLREITIGVLEVVNKQNGAFDANDRALVETLAASAAIAIENARLVETLQKQAADLQARNEELDAFAHTVAHDLQNSLTHIVGFAGALQFEAANMPAGELDLHLETIVRSGRKMSNIIKELLLLSSVRKLEVVTTLLDMGAIVAEAQQRLAYMIHQSQAKIITPASWPAVYGYAPWVEEVWVNYISNALKYGGPAPLLELDATIQANGMARFSLRDYGGGLPPTDQRRLFAPFTQLDRLRPQGHGLGLSIVRRIIDKLGGEVGVESMVGQGSVFTFTLPQVATTGPPGGADQNGAATA